MRWIAMLLGSVLTGHAFAQTPGTAIEWERYTDPAEQAYQVDLPKGWSVQSSTIRTSPVNLGLVTRLVSPDKSVYIFLGDTELAAHIVPSSVTRMRGQSEGTRYPSAGGQQNIVMRYLPGWQYAGHFVETEFAQACGGPRILETRARPDLPPPIPNMPTPGQRGEVSFTCHHGGRDLSGHAEAITNLIGQGEIQTWVVPLLDGYVAPPERANEASGIIAHILASLKLNPNWEQYQRELSQGNVAAAMQQYRQGEAQRAAINRRFAAMDQNFQAMDDIITGTGHYVDPGTGNRYDLDNSKPYKWMNGTGQIVGTDTPQSPGLNWHQLNQVPQ